MTPSSQHPDEGEVGAPQGQLPLHVNAAAPTLLGVFELHVEHHASTCSADVELKHRGEHLDLPSRAHGTDSLHARASAIATTALLLLA